MKFVLVAFLGAFLCATIASAAPTTQSPAVKNAFEKFMVYQDNRECIVEVFNDVFSQTKLNGVWITFTMKLEGLFANWRQLNTVADKSHLIRYKSITLANTLDLLSFEVPFFIEELESSNMLNKVRKAVSTECLGKSDNIDLLTDADYLALWKSLSDLSAYAIAELGDLSAKANLESWPETRTILQQQYETLTECSNGSKVDVCSIKEGIKFFKLVADFRRFALNDPQVLNLLVESA